MKVCIKNDYTELNWNYHIVYGEEKAIQNGYIIFEVPQGYEKCELSDFDSNGFNVELYNKRKESEKSKIYEYLVVSKIREKYSIDQELAILRQRDAKPDEFTEYNSYVEQCKVEVKEELNNGNE